MKPATDDAAVRRPRRGFFGWRRAWGLIASGRPGGAVAGSVMAALAAWYGGAGGAVSLAAGGATFLVTMMCMVANDVYDLDKDRRAGAHRPLSLGQISRLEGASYAVLLALLAWVIGPDNRDAHIILAFAILASIGYSPFSRHLPLFKGTYAATCCTLPLWYGAAVHDARVGWLPLVLVAAFNLGRETFLDALHLTGDAAYGVRTVAVRLGRRTARRWGIAGMLLAVAGVALAAPTLVSRSLAAAAFVAVAIPAITPSVSDERLRLWSRAGMLAGGVAIAQFVH